jgi:hypothetical protein
MTDLEESLRGASGAELKAGILSRLDALKERLAGLEKSGLPPDAFKRNEAAVRAIAAARAVASAFPVSGTTQGE